MNGETNFFSSIFEKSKKKKKDPLKEPQKTFYQAVDHLRPLETPFFLSN